MKLKNRKTGEIVELKLIQVNDKYLEDHEVDLLNGEKLTLKSLADSFDDVKEPLIKDAGAREVMRLWAKANRIPTNATTIEYHFVESLCGTESEFWDNNLHIMFYGKIAPNAIHGKIYTIEELCGEEEECKRK